MIKEIESTAGTLGGFSEVYHDNDVDDPYDSTDSVISFYFILLGIFCLLMRM
jgi:hypothetical protein